LKFFHLPKPREFKFTPRFWDPEKEERIERENRIRAELGMEVKGTPGDPAAPYRARIKGEFRKAMRHSSRISQEARRRGNNRLLVIIAILGLLLYLVFYR